MPNRGQSNHYEIAVVGGGPAGLSAAIWCSRYLHSVALLDSGSPRNLETRKVNGFLGVVDTTPAQLRHRGRQACRELGVSLHDVMVTDASFVDAEFRLATKEGDVFHAERLLLAVGLHDEWPDVPGLEAIYGSSAHVCPDCDGFDCQDKKVVVIGNGRRAVAMALNLTTWTRDIIISTNGQPADIDKQEYCDKLDALNIPVLTGPIVRVCEDLRDGRNIHCLMLEDGLQLDADKVFFAVGQHPADDLGTQLGCERDGDGQIIIDGRGHTSVQHVYAAGDITPGPQLAIVAAAQGATAALAIHKSLVPEERKLDPVGA